MKKIISLLAVGGAIVVAASCGDNLKAPADAKVTDSSGSNGSGSGFPAAPTLGTQIDRMGRPAINTALNHSFDPTTGAGSAKDAYNADESVGTWVQSYTGAFASNLGVFDVLDRGLTCTNGTCTASATASGCGNQAFYNNVPTGGGTATAMSYVPLASVLAADQLWLDTTKMVCDVPTTHQNYLSVELDALVGVPAATCGGRAPTNDVIDTSFTLLAVGIPGFNANAGFAAAFGDGVGPHADVHIDTFPFLGSAH